MKDNVFKTLNNLKSFFLKHKFWSVVIVLFIIFFGYKVFGSKTSTETRYVMSPVTKGTIVSSVSASGQVSTSNQINLQAQASGAVTYIGVEAGDYVHVGKTLFSIDNTVAQKSVRDAKLNLQSAMLLLEQFQEPPTSVAVSTINNAILDAENSKKTAQIAVDNAYTALLNSTIEVVPNGNVTNYTAPTITGNYTKGLKGTINIYIYYTGSGSSFSTSGIVSSTGVVSSTTPQPIGDSGLYIEFPSSNNSVTSWSINIPNTKALNYLSNQTAYQNALNNLDTTNRTADLTTAQQKENLALLYTPDPLSLQAKQLSVTQAQNSLTDAENNLANYYVLAPFSGTISSVTAQLGQNAGSGTTLGTIITNQQLAEISLNEVDVSKIKLGDKATLTFDAIPNLSIAGTVASIDSIGTVSSGVVTYNVKINFNTQDSRIKPGMTVNANIITKVAQDVLTVPSSAIKNGQNGTSYVEMFDIPLATPTTGQVGSPSAIPPRQQIVTTGLSDDTYTEIISGLKTGDLVVSRTMTATASAPSASAPSLLGGGNRGGAAGSFRRVTGG